MGWDDSVVRRVAVRTLLLGWAAIGVLNAQSAASGELDIAVVGNRRIEAATVRSYFHSRPDGQFDVMDLDAALKALYASGQFKDVKIERRGGALVVSVVENPVIRRLAFEGNSKSKDDQLKKEVQSQERGPLNEAVVKSDVERIVEIYRRSGRFDAEVKPKIITAPNDRVDLIFEITEGKRTGVRQVRFLGNKAYSAADLRGAIKTGETHLLSFLLDNDIYDPDRIEQDREQLRRFYLARGYADVRIVSALAEYNPERKGIVVTFTVDEGARYRVGTVDVKSSLATVDPASLNSRLRTHAGDIYNADALEKTVDDLSIEITKRGEPFATVRPRGDRLPDRHVINLTYTIEPGPRLYIERIDIHGNDKTEDRVIRREFDIAEGDAYNRALIERAERRLKNLGYFKTVKITRQPGSAPDRLIIHVNVEEQRTGEFSIAGGYSTVDGVIAEISVSERNLLGKGLYAKASVSFGQYTRGFDLALSDPYFLGNRMSLGGDLFYKQTISSSYQAYDTLTYGAKIGLGLPLNDEVSAQLRYSLYNQSVTLDPANGTASLPIQQAALAGPMWVSSIGLGLTYSTLDNNSRPHNGFRSIVNEEFAGVGGDARFIKTTEDVQYYRELTDDVVGMVRAQGGYVTAWGGAQLPLLNAFFGGPQLVRGFAPNGFGPRDVTPGTTMDNIGGNIYWATTAEVQAPVPFVPRDAGLKVALFSDVGSLWATGGSLPALSQSMQVSNSRAIRSSFGAGLVWDSMFGPLRLDYAYPLTRGSSDVTQRLHFGFGGF
jgi:outer membrane protein insertion porin family